MIFALASINNRHGIATETGSSQSRNQPYVSTQEIGFAPAYPRLARAESKLLVYNHRTFSVLSPVPGQTIPA